MRDLFLRGFKAYRYLALLIFMTAGASIAAVFAFRVVQSGFSSELLNFRYVLMLVKLVVGLAMFLPAVILVVVGTLLVIFKIFGIELKEK